MKSIETLRKETLQRRANDRVVEHMDRALTQLYNLNEKKPVKGKRLRSCTAWVFETEDYYILKSYETYVAVILKSADVMFDALRIVYGYTATSAQHITKFAHDYGAGKWGVTERVTGR